MKVIFRISKLGFGGAEQVFLSIAREFKNKYSYEIIFVVDHHVGENISVAEAMGCQVVTLNASRTLTSIVPFAKVIDNIKPDVVISAYTDTNAACLLSVLISRHKPAVIVSEHASLHEHWQAKSMLKKKILKFYVGWVYKLSDKVLCVSKGLQNQIDVLLKNPEKTTTIHNPVRFEHVEVNEREIRTASKMLNLVAVGRIAPPKDYSTLVEAIQKIKQEHPVKLRIVGGIGDTRELNKVKQEVVRCKLTEDIEFVGYTDTVEVYYKEADIFVLSSAWEGFGNVIVEAMAFGLPVVSTNCNYGPAEILANGKYGRLVNVGDSDALAAAITEEWQRPLTNKAALISRSQEFSEDKISQQYHSLIQEVISE